jgi:hypothetical protein
MKRTLLAAAFLSITAFGATVSETADVNFKFRTPAGEHAAGSYKLLIRDNAPVAGLVELRNTQTGDSVMFYPVSAVQGKRSGENPRLVFKCAAGNCNLAEIWTSTRGFTIRQRKPTPAEAERMATSVPETVTVAVAE